MQASNTSDRSREMQATYLPYTPRLGMRMHCIQDCSTRIAALGLLLLAAARVRLTPATCKPADSVHHQDSHRKITCTNTGMGPPTWRCRRTQRGERRVTPEREVFSRLPQKDVPSVTSSVGGVLGSALDDGNYLGRCRRMGVSSADISQGD